MAANHLEGLVAEWYAWNGFFVRRNVLVGRRPRGGYECELDVVAFHSGRKELVHIEPSLDADSWPTREARYRKKFEAGPRHIATLLAGLELPEKIDQQAIFLYAGRSVPASIGSGRIVHFGDFMREILAEVRTRPLNSAMVTEQYPLLRTLQFAARTWPVDEPSP